MTTNRNSYETLCVQIRSCEACPLAKTRTNAVPGEGRADAQIMFVGEAPGKVNDEQGRPFVGHGGAVFDKLLAHVNLVRADVYVTNTVKCWPPENRTPRALEVRACTGHLKAELVLVNPLMVVALGRVAERKLVEVRNETKGNWTLVQITHPNALRYLKGGMKSLVAQLAVHISGGKQESLQTELFGDGNAS